MKTKGVSEDAKRRALAAMKTGLENWQDDQAFWPSLAPLFDDRHTHIPETLSDLFLDWNESGKRPSLLSLLAHILDVMEIEETYPLVDMVAIAAILGDGQGDDLPFHNHEHIVQVVVSACVLAFHHNRLNPYDPLEISEVLSLFSAACIHDLGHDGKGNFDADGRHLPSRLEIQAVEMAEPFLRQVCEDERIINRIGLMVVATDVSESEGNDSPSSTLKRVMMSRIAGTAMPVIPMHLHALGHDARLGLMALLLEEADLIPSMALSYDLSKQRTVMAASESQKLTPDAATLSGFIEKICDGLILSPVGKEIFAENFDLIRARALKEGAQEVTFAA